jgi:hypothetical protein
VKWLFYWNGQHFRFASFGGNGHLRSACLQAGVHHGQCPALIGAESFIYSSSDRFTVTRVKLTAS